MRPCLFLQIFFVSIAFQISAQEYYGQKQELLLYSIEKLNKINYASIERDNEGFIWIETGEKLYRYDGTNLKVIDQTGCSSSCILCTRDNQIWYEQNARIKILDLNSWKFLDFQELTNCPDLELRLMDLFEDKAGNIWIGSRTGLYKYSPQTKTLENVEFRHTTNENQKIVRSIFQDRTGCIWIGTFDGIYKIEDPDQVTDIMKYDWTNEYHYDPNNNLVLSFYEDSRTPDQLWVGTETGLCLMDKRSGKVNKFRKEKGLEIGNNCIKSIVRYSENQLMLGTDNGLYLFDLESQTIAGSFFKDSYRTNTIAGNVINQLKRFDNDLIWISTNNGITQCIISQSPFTEHKLHDRQSKTFIPEINAISTDGDRLFFTSPNAIIESDTQGCILNETYTTEAVARTIQVDRFGSVWIGSSNGIYCYDPATGKNLHFGVDDKGIPLKYVTRIVFENDESLWTNTINGICHLALSRDEKGRIMNSRLQIFQFAQGSLTNSIPSSLDIDCMGNLWVGTYSNGLIRFDPVSNRFNYRPAELKDLSNSRINCILCSKDKIWFGLNSGLGYYDCVTRNYTTIDLQAKVRSIIEDQNGDIWIASEYGISRFDSRDNSLSNHYNLGRHNVIERFTENNCAIDKNGILYFAGNNGFLKFNPANLQEQSQDIPLLFTGLNINGSDINPGDKIDNRIVYDRPLHKTEQLCFVDGKKAISLHFSLLDYNSLSQHKFKYRFTQKNGESLTFENNNGILTLHHLKRGKYTVDVTACNTEGDLCENGIRVQLSILGRVWERPFMIFLYCLVGLAIVLFIIYENIQSLKYKRQMEKQDAERKLQEQSDQLKMDFFTNISHEFKTPLTLISGPVATLLEETGQESHRKLLSIIKDNSVKLQTMVEQIIDFRKIESHSFPLFLRTGDLIPVIRDVCESFHYPALAKEIDLEFRSEVPELIMNFDKSKIEKIISNLLSNAIKFTPGSGKISVLITRDVASVTIEISDTGVGIARKDLELIFNRFYQADNNADQNTKGTGIGLFLAREFTLMHHGEIHAESVEGHGSRFVVQLPIAVNAIEEAAAVAENGDLPRVLIVDDSDEIRAFLKLSLGNEYCILEAANGDEALQAIRKTIPDIVISDYMMPGMSGIELIRNIRGNVETDHIPCILLTVRDTDQDRIEGLSNGADDYITKPFNPQVLRIKIRSQLAKMQKLKERYSSLSYTRTTLNDTPESSTDKLMREVLSAIEANMSNENYDINDLSSAVGISHQSLYRKIKAVTGMTLNEYIRTIRLTRAEQLLRSTDYTVSEIAYMVGFGNRSYFSRIFTKKYGISPKDYSKRCKTESGSSSGTE